MNIKQLKEIIKDLPDDSLVLYNDPFSEFSFDILGANKSRTCLGYEANDGTRYYESWTEDEFKNLLDDNEEKQEELEKEYQSTLLLYINK